MGAEIRLNGLTVTYGRQAVLTGLELVVPAGTILAVAGLSGCGKTTLLKAICGQLDTAVATVVGEVLLNGTPTTEAAVEVGMCFQKPFLFPWLDTHANVSLCRRLHPAAHPLDPADQVLRDFGLSDAAEKLPSELSGGMAQRVALAREFARRPDVLLLDEPFANLDCVTRDQLNEHLVAFSRRLGTTVVIVTHDPEEAVYVADAVAVLTSGRLIEPPGQFNGSELKPADWRFTTEFRTTVEWILAALKDSGFSRR